MFFLPILKNQRDTNNLIDVRKLFVEPVEQFIQKGGPINEPREPLQGYQRLFGPILDENGCLLWKTSFWFLFTSAISITARFLILKTKNSQKGLEEKDTKKGYRKKHNFGGDREAEDEVDFNNRQETETIQRCVETLSNN